MGMTKNYKFFAHVNKILLQSMIYWLYIMPKMALSDWSFFSKLVAYAICTQIGPIVYAIFSPLCHLYLYKLIMKCHFWCNDTRWFLFFLKFCLLFLPLSNFVQGFNVIYAKFGRGHKKQRFFHLFGLLNVFQLLHGSVLPFKFSWLRHYTIVIEDD
jgi:hypothetical protein